MGRTESAIQKYESKENKDATPPLPVTPPLDVLEKIAKVLEVDMFTLLGMDDAGSDEILNVANNMTIPPWKMLGMNERTFLEIIKDKSKYDELKVKFGERHLIEYIEIAEALINQGNRIQEVIDNNLDINILGDFISENIKNLKNHIKSIWPRSYINNEIVLKSIIIDWFARYYSDLRIGKSDFLKIFRVLEEESRNLDIDEHRQPEEVFIKLLDDYIRDNKVKTDTKEGD